MTNGYNGRHIKENAFNIIPASDSIIPKNNNIIHMNKQWTMHFHFLNMNILFIYIHTKENIERERERKVNDRERIEEDLYEVRRFSIFSSPITIFLLS